MTDQKSNSHLTSIDDPSKHKISIADDKDDPLLVSHPDAANLPIRQHDEDEEDEDDDGPHQLGSDEEDDDEGVDDEELKAQQLNFIQQYEQD